MIYIWDWGMIKDLPNIIKKIWFDFSRDNKKVWELDIPVEEIDIEELIWHFEIPFWHLGEKKYTLKPKDVLKDSNKYKEQYERTMMSDLVHPIDIMENKWKRLILDGLHRLLKLKILWYKEVKVRKIPRWKIKDIKK